MTTVLIRADAAPAIGIGHVMRCLAVAEALRDGGDAPVFAAACMPEALTRRILDRGCQLRPVHAAVPGDASDLASTIDLAREIGAGAAILDGYHFDLGWRQVLARAIRPLLCFDDLAEGNSLPADLVVNASPAAFALPYAAIAPHAVHLLGPSFAPLRSEIRAAMAAPRMALAQRNRLLLSFGGSDPLGLTGTVLRDLPEQLPGDVGIDAVCGSSTAALAEIRRVAVAAPRVTLHVDPSDLTGLMGSAGLALSAGGGTMAELAALGVPTLVAIVAANQLPGVRAAVQAGWVEALDARDSGNPGPDLADRAARLWADFERRQALARAAIGTFDGQGAQRIAAALRQAIAAGGPG